MATRDSPSRRRDDYCAHGEPPVRVLAVDDEPTYVRRLSLILTRAGFDVQTAPDGATAIDRLRHDRDITILVIDLTMPGMNGFETVRRARETSPFPGLYAILLTASDGTDVKLRAFESGFDDFITKASPDSEIIAKLRSAARRVKMERRLHMKNEELETLALTDELTGVANRRALFREADVLLAAGRALSVVLLDLDRFKHINDTHGHLMGDRILAGVAACLRRHTRVGDVIARYGGDEFVLLLPDTNHADASALTSRIRAEIAKLRWQSTIAVNIGIGIATGRTDTTITTLLAEADRRLYEAKNGRAVWIAAAEPPLSNSPAERGSAAPLESGD